MGDLFGIDTEQYPMTGNEEYMYWGDRSRGATGHAFTKEEYFARYRPHNHEIVNSIVACCGAPKNVLSLGCGLGFDVERWHELEVPVLGVEITRYAIERSLVGRFIVHGSAHELSIFRTDSYELVLALELMEHLPPEITEAAIAEIRRVGYYKAILTIGRGTSDVTHINLKPREEWERLLGPLDYDLQERLSQHMKDKGLVDMVWDRIYVMELGQ
ncbi:class I SAM-dependent methyltransferase [Chloroflexota bacterium]